MSLEATFFLLEVDRETLHNRQSGLQMAHPPLEVKPRVYQVLHGVLALVADRSRSVAGVVPATPSTDRNSEPAVRVQDRVEAFFHQELLESHAFPMTATVPLQGISWPVGTWAIQIDRRFPSRQQHKAADARRPLEHGKRHA